MTPAPSDRAKQALALIQEKAKTLGRPASSSLFSFEGKNYGIGDTFAPGGGTVRSAFKNMAEAEAAGFRLADPKFVKPPHELQGSDFVNGSGELTPEQISANEAWAKSRDEFIASGKAQYIQSSKTGARDYLDTAYIQKDGALIPVGSKARYEPSAWVGMRDSAIKPAALIGLSSFGAPIISGALGGGLAGTIGAGAAISGGTTALAGGNANQVLRNALTGAATAGISSGAAPAINSALGNTAASQAIARAVTSGGIAALRGQNVGQAALGGINPQAAQVLRLIQTISRAQSRPGR